MSDRLFVFFRRILQCGGAAVLALALLMEPLRVGAPGLGPYQWCAIAFALFLILLSLAADRLRSRHEYRSSERVLLVGLTTFTCLVGAFAIIATTHLKRRWVEAERFRKLKVLQSFYQLDPELGYRYQPNLNVLLPSRDQWLDAEVEGITIDPITTDSTGFDNHPSAIKQENGPVDVIGIGDSFMDGASHVFYQVFRDHGLRYHSYSMPRYCPPQYNQVLSEIALPRKPRHVIYGLFVNDFAETVDFEHWKASETDWYTFHGGTIAGRSEVSLETSRDAQVARVKHYVSEAIQMCLEHGTEMTLMTIPDKDYIVQGVQSPEVTVMFDELISYARSREVRVVDMRPIFRTRPSPTKLYWRLDGHWSHAGIRLAAQEWLDRIDEPSSPD